VQLGGEQLQPLDIAGDQNQVVSVDRVGRAKPAPRPDVGPVIKATGRGMQTGYLPLIVR